MYHNKILAAAFLVGLTACGGSDESSTSPEVPQFLVSTVAGIGGSLSPAKTQVRQGANTSLTIKVEPGYKIDSVTGCGGNLDGNQFTTGAVNSACTVTASFKKLTFSVTATASVGGTVTPTSQQVEHGNSTTVEIKPQLNYAIRTVSGCSGQLQNEIYRTGSITANCHINAEFLPTAIQVTTAAANGGRFNIENPMVRYGESLQLTLLPDTGFDITTATGCGGKLQGAVFTTAPIIDACTIEAKFHDSATVVFPDPSLDKAVRQALGLDGVSKIAKTQLAQLKILELPTGQVADLQGLQHAKELTLLKAASNKIADLWPIQNLTKLEALDLSSTPLTSLQSLSTLKNLRRLWLFESSVTDLSPLQGLALTEFAISTTKALDLSPLQGMPIQIFVLQSSPTIDLTPLANAPLVQLDVRNTKIQDLSVLKNLSNLKNINISGSAVSDIGPLRQAIQLTSVNLQSSLVQNLDVLNELALAVNATLGISGCIDQRGYSRHLEQLEALKRKLGLVLYLGGTKRTDCQDTLAGTNLTMQAQVVERTLKYSWQITGSSTPVYCAMYLDQDDQQLGTMASQFQECATIGNATFDGYKADQFRPAMWFDNGIGGEKLVTFGEVGAAPVQPALQSLDLSQITISAKPLLVAERDALMRLHVTAAQSPTQLPSFQLELQLNGLTHLLDTKAPTKLPQTKVHRSLNDSYQAIIPASWMQPGLLVKVLQDGQLVRTYTPNFAPARPLAIKIVPFQLGDQVATLPDIATIKNALRTYWPLNQIDIRPRAPYQLKAGGSKSTVYVMLAELADLRKIEGDNVYYYGYFKREMGDDCCGGLGYIGFPVAVGFDTDNGEILGHEIGHNFGRPHVGCGSPSNPDQNYPYATNSIGAVGLDLAKQKLILPEAAKDIMSYCDPIHVSDYNVAEVQDFITKNPPRAFSNVSKAQVTESPAVASTANALYISGTLQGNNLHIRTVLPLARAPQNAAPSGHIVKVLNQQGKWFEFNLELLELDHPVDASMQHFTVELPQMAIKRLEIWQNNVMLAFQENADITAGKMHQQQRNQAQIKLQERANEICLNWPADNNATLSVIHHHEGKDTVLALNETARQFCRDSSALPTAGEWRLIWRQQLSVQEFRQPR